MLPFPLGAVGSSSASSVKANSKSDGLSRNPDFSQVELSKPSKRAMSLRDSNVSKRYVGMALMTLQFKERRLVRKGSIINFKLCRPWRLGALNISSTFAELIFESPITLTWNRRRLLKLTRIMISQIPSVRGWMQRCIRFINGRSDSVHIYLLISHRDCNARVRWVSNEPEATGSKHLARINTGLAEQ